MDPRMFEEDGYILLPLPDPRDVPPGGAAFASLVDGPNPAQRMENAMRAYPIPLVIHRILVTPIGITDEGHLQSWVVAIVEPL